MDITWDDDEGYELRYDVLAKRYGMPGPYDKASQLLQSEIRELRDKESAAQSLVSNAVRARESAGRELADLEAQIERYRNDVAVQQGYFAVEQKPEYAARVRQLEEGMASLGRRGTELQARIDSPLPASGLLPEEKQRLASAVKLHNQLFGLVHGYQETALPARHQGEPYALGPDEYARLVLAVRREPPAYCGVWKTNIVVRPEDFSAPDARQGDWPRLSQTAMEILDHYRRHKIAAAAWGGSLYAVFGQTFWLRISADRLREPVDWKTFRIAMVNGGTSVPHPVFEGYRLRLPGGFMFFNSTIIVRHEFLPRLVVQSCAQPAPLPDDDDYDD